MQMWPALMLTKFIVGTILYSYSLACTLSSISHPSLLLTPTVSPTASSVVSHAVQTSSSLDSTIGTALIGLLGVLFASALGFYQIRKNIRIEREKQQLERELQDERFEHEKELARYHKEIDALHKRKEQEEQNEATKAEMLRLDMLRAQNNSMRAQTYRRALAADPRISHVQILDMSRPLAVTDIYIRVRVHQQARASYELDPAIQTAEKERDPNVWHQASLKYLEKRTGSAIDPDEAIRKYKRCIFVGDPGAGKTTLLKYLTLKAASNQLDRLPNLPIRIELNAFASSGHKDLPAFVAQEWEERYAFPAEDALAYIEEQLQAGQALLLCDALDETVVGETTDMAEASYQRVAEAIMLLASRYPQVPIVVTARKKGYQQRGPLTGFTELEVLDFRSEDIQQFITNWFQCSPEQEEQLKGEELKRKLERAPRIQALAANPLLLSLIVLVYEAQLDLPDRRAELYKRCIDVLLTEWDAKRNIRRRREFKPEYKRQLLAELAWHFHLQGKRYFPEREALEVIAQFLPIVRISAEENGKILAEIANEHGLLKEQAKGLQGFLHLTLQEYFAAQYATDHQQLDTLLAHRGDLWWEEVLQLYAGSTPDASPLLRKLLYPVHAGGIPEDIFATNLILAGQCLAARPTLRQIDLWDHVIDQLFHTLTTTPYALVQEHCARTLAAIRGEEVNKRLLSLLSDKQLDKYVQGSIARALGELGERSVVPELMRLLGDKQLDEDIRVRMLSDKQLDEDIRVRIAEALGAIGERSVVPELMKLLREEQLDKWIRVRIAKALGAIGERSVVPELVKLLREEQLDIRVRGEIAGALGKLGERSVVPELMKLLREEQLDKWIRVRIAEALEVLVQDITVVTELVALLPQSDIANTIHRALWSICRRMGVRVLVADASEGEQYKVVLW